MKYAAIDIGSNAVRLLIADIKIEEGQVSFKKNTFIRLPIRLGADVFVAKHISEPKMSDIIKAMRAYRYVMDLHGVEQYMACATSAMREAENGPILVEQIRRETGIELEIIEGKREASIIYSSHIDELLNPKHNYLYIDVGGGSTEVSVFAQGKMLDSTSFNIGTIRLLDNRVADASWEAMKEWVEKHAKGRGDLYGIGTGGNINKLYKMSGQKGGKAMKQQQLLDLQTQLQAHSLEERIDKLGLKEDRADVIVPAAEIFLKLMQWSGAKEIYVPKVGLVDGIIHLLIEEYLPMAGVIREEFD